MVAFLSKFKKTKHPKTDNTLELEHKSEELNAPLSFPSLIENIKNDGITFDKDHFVMQTGLGDKKYGRSFYVRPSGYPRTVRIGWLESLFTGDDLDVSVHIEPIDRTVAIKKLQDKIDELDTVITSAVKRGDQAKVEDAETKKSDTKFLQRQIKSNQNGLYYVSIQATVFAKTLDDLNAKCVEIEGLLGGESIEIVNAYGRQKQCFLSTLPLGKNYLSKTSRNLDQQSLTAIFPHASSKLNHTGGMPIGRYDREYVYYNNFDPKLNNYSVGIFGESGAGKGVMVKQLIGRGPMDGITQHYIIDVEPEYIDLTLASGGIVIPIRSTKDENANRINPLDIFPEKEIKNKGAEDEYVVEKINVNEKIKEVIEFFKVMKESCTVDGKGLNPVELGVLNDILEDLYENKGITEDPSSIYENIESIDEISGKIVWSKRYVEMPTISDVYKRLEDERKNGYEELKELCSVVKLFTRGKAFGLFDGQTRINNNTGVSLDDAPIVTFDISKLSANGIERPLAQHVIMTWLWNRAIVGNPKAKKRVIVDEAWMMLKYAAMMDFILLLAARGRKWNVSLTLVSQRYEMFHRTEKARDIVAQMNTVLFMKQSDEDIEPILETFKFSQEVGEMIRTAGVGEVVMKAGKEIVAFVSEPTQYEWNFLNTNQNVEMGKKKRRTRSEEIKWLETPVDIQEEVVA
ncbi:VirB4 family type IV secretion system protein [Brevibacillus sp. 179-C9.3 HS]|uniref:VirB4 family type IV secretion system protein n=1 Tax=unclassified Brevibacillus TaxID=2684853 RepID=UPI0039A21E69